MKAKNLFLLVLTLIALVVAAKWSRNRPASRSATTAPAKLIGFDVNASDLITIASAGQTTALAQVGQKWVVRNLWDYPADYDAIAENVRRLAALEGLPVRGGEQMLAEFGLDPDATNAPGADLLTVSFSNTGQDLGVISLGAPRLSRADGGPGMGGYPDGQYVRAGDGPVLLVKDFLGGLPRRPQDWVGKDLVAVPRSEIDYVMVRQTNGAQYGLLADTNGVFQLSDLKAGETMKPESADDVAGALQSLSLVNVLDPKAPAAQTGLDHPSTYVAKLRNGLVYTVKLGNVAEADNGRILQLGVTYETPDAAVSTTSTNAPPPMTDFARKAETDNARLAPWVFVVSDYAAGNFLKPRADLLQAPTNAPAPANAPAAPAP